MPLARSAHRPFTARTPRGLPYPLGVFPFVSLSGLASNQWTLQNYLRDLSKSSGLLATETVKSGFHRNSLKIRKNWCQGAESNRGHPDFQSGALPLSYPGISFAALNYSTQKAGVKHFRRDSKIAEVAKTWAERLGKVSGWHQTFGAGGGNCAGV